jgi:hypothetical protein
MSDDLRRELQETFRSDKEAPVEQIMARARRFHRRRMVVLAGGLAVVLLLGTLYLQGMSNSNMSVRVLGRSSQASPNFDKASFSPSRGAIPWVDTTLPEDVSAERVAVPPGTPPCSITVLRPQVSMRSGDTGGAVGVNVTVTDHATRPCFIEGPPVLQLLDDLGRPLNISTAAPQGPTVNDLVLLEPGESAAAGNEWTQWCGPAAPVASIRVTFPNKVGSIVLSPPAPGAFEVTAPCDSSAVAGRPPSATPTGTMVSMADQYHGTADQPPYPFDRLAIVGLRVPGTVVAGHVLQYELKLANRTSAAISLAICPIYNETLQRNSLPNPPLASDSYLLNCSPGAIRAGTSKIFAMRIYVPASAEHGPATLTWASCCAVKEVTATVYILRP